MIRIVHIITSLTTGGAQSMLYKLLSATDRSAYDVHVVCMMSQSTFGVKIEALNIPVHYLEMKSGYSSLQAVPKLRRLARSIQPDIVQGWMYHANLAANAFRRMSGREMALAWNIRHSLHEVKKEKPLTQVMIKTGARMSASADKIVYNSRTSAQQHATLGFSDDRRIVLPNGFDTAQFRPSVSARFKLREALGLSDATPLIGIVGRFHPMKCHTNFIQAAIQLHQSRPDVHFVMLGHSILKDNPVLAESLGQAPASAQDHFHLLGERTDVAELTAAFDIAVSSSSWGEAFPNVIGEAMSCAVPCVVTDVGDASYVLGGYGVVVPPHSAESLYDGMCRMLNMDLRERQLLGANARQRVIDEFSLDKVYCRYAGMYQQLVAGKIET